LLEALSRDEAEKLLDDIKFAFRWSLEVGYWLGREGVPEYYVEVTDAGYQLALRILEEDGWPAEPLPECE
jgi:hypothetical protein